MALPPTSPRTTPALPRLSSMPHKAAAGRSLLSQHSLQQDGQPAAVGAAGRGLRVSMSTLPAHVQPPSPPALDAEPATGLQRDLALLAANAAARPASTKTDSPGPRGQAPPQAGTRAGAQAHPPRQLSPISHRSSVRPMSQATGATSAKTGHNQATGKAAQAEIRL